MLPPRHAFDHARFAGCRIGLLGGSFNPAHAGHLAISREALKRLRLHAVWWLVSPGNPLKNPQDMANLEERVKGAETIGAQDPRLLVTTLETALGTRYTADTLRKLKARFPRTRFVWLMGADNLVQIPRWQQWESIFRLMPMVVFRRAPFTPQHAIAKAARRFAAFRVRAALAARLFSKPAPSWLVLLNRLHKESASAIRAQRRRHA